MTIGKVADSKKTVFVLGVNGFVGQHLARELKNSGCRVVGIGNTENLASGLTEVVDSYIQCDLADSSVTSKLDLSKANSIINLAGLANVGASFSNEEEYLRINRLVHTNICDALEKSKQFNTRVIAVSTGAVYDSSETMPLKETSKVISKGSPYALSKLQMEKALKSYQKKGLDIITVRPFNHTGPGQGPGFLVPDLLFQLRSLEPQAREILVGNLSSKRDYTDVRDIVCAYRLLALAPTGDLSSRLYNICSGVSTSGQSILSMLLEELGLTDKITIKIDLERIRPNDPADIYGSRNLLSQDTGWSPRITLAQTLHDFVTSLS